MLEHETETIEFKRTTAQLKEGVISLSAMLNKHGGGTVYFGVRDDGSIFGQEIGKKTTSEISNEVRTSLKPLPDVSIECLDFSGKSVISVSAKGDDTPYSAYGRYYIRVDDSDIQMDTRALWRFFEKKDKTYSKWEKADSGYDIDVVDEDLLIKYIREANDVNRMDYVYRNPREALEKLHLLTPEGHLNNAGYYLFGNNGPVTLKEVVYPTDSRESFTDLRQFHGNIFECIAEGLKYIQNNLRYHVEIVGIRREETLEIPLKAIREILINSFAHCQYQEGDNNEITITRSRLKIYNPGPILMDIDPKSFASGKVGSKIRNPLIATVLFKNGFIDAFGTGFDRTFRSCARERIDYTYSNDELGFSFVFHRNPMERTSSPSGPRTSKPLSGLDALILSEVQENCYTTTEELARNLNSSTATVARHLQSLQKSGRLKREGSKKNGYWDVFE